MDLGPDDVGYVCMPLFHSNALMVGWAPSIVVRRVGRPGRAGSARRAGCPTSAATAPRSSTTRASRWRTSSPRREQPDDADNPLRVAFGNEGSPEVVDRLRRALRRRGDRRVRRDRGRHRGQPRRARSAPARSGRPARTSRSSTRTATSCRAPRFDADGRLVNADECVGEIVNTAGAGPVRGLLQQRRGQREDPAVRLVLERRPRLPRRRPLPLLRGPQRRLDPRRRRELPGAADRDDDRAAPRRRAGRGLRRARRPGRRPGDGRRSCCATAPAFDPAAFARVARRAGRRSGRSGGRATCASCATRRRPARTRS